jgi:hypothetical protein
MARGWESKDVESQVEDRKNVAETSDKAKKSAEDLRRETEKRGLVLSRKRVVSDLEVATHPNHRKSLEAALAHLDKRIAELS